MVSIPPAILPPFEILYQPTKGGRETVPENGRWNLRNSRFPQGSRQTLYWKMIPGPGVRKTDKSVTDVIDYFNEQVQSTGVCNNGLKLRKALQFSSSSEDHLEIVFRSYLQTVAKSPTERFPDVIVLLLSSKN